MNQYLLEDSDSQTWAVALGDVGARRTAFTDFFFNHKKKKALEITFSSLTLLIFDY